MPELGVPVGSTGERERLEFINRIIRHNPLNGLNVVRGRADFLIDDATVEATNDIDVDEHLETVHDRVVDMADLIQTMRGYMDAVVHDAEQEWHPVRLRPVVERELELIRDAHGVAVDAHDLPDEDVRVVADDLLGGVVDNVLTNAVSHNDRETPRIEVWMASDTLTSVDATAGAVDSHRTGATDGGTVEGVTTGADSAESRPTSTVNVADNGPGITDDEKRAVLEKGVSRLSEPGNGFGLYLVKEMMETYDDRIDIRDNEPGGTVFALTLPLAD